MRILFAVLLGLAPLQAPADNSIVEKHAGVYWVPVGTSNEARYAVFSLPEIEVRRSNKEFKIRYPLPLELTGAPNMIELEGKIVGSGPLQLKGPLGFGECPAVDQLESCSITYENLAINTQVRSDLLKQISRTPTELELREKVAAGFCLAAAGGGEPCGFLTVGY